MESISKRLEKAYSRAKPILDNRNSMNFEETLTYMKTDRNRWNHEQNIITRYRNLEARDLGYAQGFEGMIKEKQKNGEIKYG